LRSRARFADAAAAALGEGRLLRSSAAPRPDMREERPRQRHGFFWRHAWSATGADAISATPRRCAAAAPAHGMRHGAAAKRALTRVRPPIFTAQREGRAAGVSRAGAADKMPPRIAAAGRRMLS